MALAGNTDWASSPKLCAKLEDVLPSVSLKGSQTCTTESCLALDGICFAKRAMALHVFSYPLIVKLKL